MAKNKIQDPYKMELLDLWNEVGGQMVIKYHIATIKPDKGDLQQLRDKGFKTDVMTVIMSAFIGHGKSQEETLAFLQGAEAAGAAPSVTFEAAEGEALNITGKENNPMVDALVQAINKQGVEEKATKGCGMEFPHFGASYPDARCCDGYLWDMDSWDESLRGFTIGGDDPCPFCNTEEWLETVLENETFDTKEDALDWVEQMKKKYHWYD